MIPIRLPLREPAPDLGRTRPRCHAGCAASDIAAALGIGLAELFPDGQPRGMQVEATYDYRDVSYERVRALAEVLS